MSALQRFRLVSVIIVEGVGYLFVLWAMNLQLQSAINNTEIPDVFGFWLSILMGFFFLAIGLLSIYPIKRQISEKLLYWLTKPALILCVILFCLYVWLIFPYIV